MTAALALLLAGCSNTEPEDAESDTADPQPAASDTAESDAAEHPETDDDAEEPDSDSEPIDFPETPAGTAAKHALEVLNAEEDSHAEDWDDRLHEELSGLMSADELAEVFNLQIRPAGPFTAIDYQGTDTASVTRLEGNLEDLDLHIEVSDEGLLTTIAFTEAQDRPEPAASFEEVEERFAELPAQGQLLVVQDGEELLSMGDGDPAALGSVFKLWVLLAAAEAIDEGETAWDETLELGEEHISLPSGNLQNEDPGFEITVEDAALAMISISDNTATDLLIDHLGRDTVQQTFENADPDDPDLWDPMLTTRELFQLRWGDPELGQEYSDADTERRYEILDELEDRELEISQLDITADDGADRDLEWYATADDIVAVHQLLEDSAADHPEIREILGSNPGVISEDPWWDYLAFKGGNSPGVWAGSWLAVDDEGTERTVVLLVSEDPDEYLQHQMDFMFLALDALEVDAP